MEKLSRKKINEVITSKRLVLNFDVNKTLILEDSVQNYSAISSVSELKKIT
jgi:hypothetical protein